MKAAFVIFVFLISGNLFSQKEVASWIKNNDRTEFKISYHKKDIPKVVYQLVGIKPRKLVNLTRAYSPSCTNPVRGQLNWVAKHGKNRVVCITKGSSAVITIIYWLDYSSGKLRAYSTTGPVNREITFNGFLELLNPAKFSWRNQILLISIDITSRLAFLLFVYWNVFFFFSFFGV